MNEEQLRIIIKAITDEAEKNIKAVREELDKAGQQGKEASKEIDTSLKGVTKSIGAAKVAIAGLAVAIAALGAKSAEYEKNNSKLKASFQSAGSTAEQASKTYKELYRYLGDADTATEAAQQLAQLTTNEKELAQWTNILKGVYASYGSSIEQAGLAEAINHSSKLGSVQGTLADALEWSGITVEDYNEQLANASTEQERQVMIMQTLNGLYGNAAAVYEQNNQALLNYNEAQAEFQQVMAEVGKEFMPVISEVMRLAAGLLTKLKPAIEVVAAAILILIECIGAIADSISGLFGDSADTAGKTADSVDDVSKGVSAAVSGSNKLADALKDGQKEAEKLKRATMGFDELNVVSKPTSSSGGGGGGSKIDIAPIDTSGLGFEDIEENIENIKEKAKGLLTVVGLIGGGIAAWKLVNFIGELKKGGEALEAFKTSIKNLGGAIMIAAGAFLFIKGFLDAWQNGVDWENMALMVGGVALAVGGLYIALGPLAAAIGLIVGGIAMVVVGVKDLVENGYSMEAVILVAIGVIAILIGVIWAFNAALLANPITWVVVAIIALIAIFVVLWNEVDGFRQFFIDCWDWICQAFNAVVAWLGQACKDIAQFFVDCWNGIKKAFSAVGSFFSGCWETIKKAFSAVGKWFSDIFTGAWNGIKKAFSAVGSFFTGIWNKIKEIFSKVGSTIADAVSNAFSSAVNWVLEKAIGIINGFIKAINFAIGIINAIPGVNISTLKLLEVPKLAKGGIIDKATLAVIGEQGKEAVMPLENNIGWIDTLADKLAERNGGNQKIVLMLNEKELGTATIGAINNITRQTGKLQLAMV